MKTFELDKNSMATFTGAVVNVSVTSAINGKVHFLSKARLLRFYAMLHTVTKGS